MNTIPLIHNNFKAKDIDKFFYEYAIYKGIDITPFEISQKTLDIKLNNIYTESFKIELLDTISISNPKENLIELNSYTLKNYKIKANPSIFNLFSKAKYLSGKLTLEFDKTRDLIYLSKFEIWNFDFSLNDYFNSSVNFLDLLKSLGYNPNDLLFREKICILARLLPYVEKNFNLIEITKPQVGKSYIFDKIITNNTIVKKLGDLTEANLFSHLNSSKEEAILKNYSLLCIDEFHKGDLSKIVSGLQTFMENGLVSRGNKKYQSDTSIIMFANFKESNTYKKIFINPKKYNPFKDISGIDNAFLERINYINPSFGMRTLNDSMFLNKNENRIPVSLYQNLFSELRKVQIDFTKLDPNICIFNNGIPADTRTTKSIFKTTSAFLKLLFPQTLKNIIEHIPLDSLDISYLEICFYLSMEGISPLNVLIEKNNNLSLQFLGKTIHLSDMNKFKLLISYFNNFPSEYIIASPHRYSYYDNFNLITKIPLDTIGIEENIQENLVYTTHGLNFLNNNFLNIPQIYTNNFFTNGSQVWFNGFQPFNLINIKSFNKNYLFGYNLTYPQQQTSFPQIFNTTYFANMICLNNLLNCPKCKAQINLFNNVNILVLEQFASCPNCNQEVFNYELFPAFFKDYNG